jgi:hypothetical protein
VKNTPHVDLGKEAALVLVLERGAWYAQQVHWRVKAFFSLGAIAKEFVSLFWSIVNDLCRQQGFGV